MSLPCTCCRTGADQSLDNLVILTVSTRRGNSKFVCEQNSSSTLHTGLRLNRTPKVYVVLGTSIFLFFFLISFLHSCSALKFPGLGSSQNLRVHSEGEEGPFAGAGHTTVASFCFGLGRRLFPVQKDGKEMLV